MLKRVLAAVVLFVFFGIPTGAEEARGFRVELKNRASDRGGFAFLDNYRVTVLSPGTSWGCEVSETITTPFEKKAPDVARFVMCAKVVVEFTAPPRWATDPAVVGEYALTQEFFHDLPVPFELAIRSKSIMTYLKGKARSESDLALMSHQLKEWVRRSELLKSSCQDPVEISVTLDWSKTRKHSVTVLGNKKDGYTLKVR